ncbi:MAG: hypothetical protein V2I33_03710 [Kangiellaceae bacterium]|jgi:REP element-mobilizing transposase RayT|nr:hypothetical protein [Kangiellaceae bacterium]
MTQPRKRLIDLNTTPYYHCISRCVRRAFLCGECHLTGKNYEHRKGWVQERIAFLSKVFAIDIASYAVMSNHYHLVIRVDADKAKSWSDNAVIQRWGQLYSVPVVVKQAQKSTATKAIKLMAKSMIDTWRSRLIDISWFMRCLNEFLARRANTEDECTGRFWEGRFKSQALLDQAAVLTAMAYVDLNPIRAGISKTPEKSVHTSIQQRIKLTKKEPVEHNIKLMTLSSNQSQRNKNSVAFSKQDYFDLVDWIGRVIRDDKRGFIDNKLPPILNRLNLAPDGFIELLKREDNIAGLTVVGSPTALANLIENTETCFIKGMSRTKRLYAT